MTDTNQLLLGLGYCLFMLIIGVIFQKYPPKKINFLYGYRTSRSMANETVWKTANKYASSYMIKMTLYSFIVPILGYFLFPHYTFMMTILGHTLLVVSILWFTETYLKKHFDNKGNPK